MQSLLNDRRLLLPVLLTAVAIAVGSVLIIVLTGDATSGGAATATPASQSAKGGATRIEITDFVYAPENLTVEQGAKVSWVNNDAAPHTATAGDDFDTGTLKKGDSKTVTLKKAGTFAYICTIHPFMKATVVVK